MTDRGHQPTSVRLQRPATLGRQHEARHWFSPAKLLVDRNEPGRMQAPGVGGEVAIRQLRGPSEADKLLPLLHRQRRQDPQPTRVGNQRIKSHGQIIGP